jgi:ATP-dependent DNA helicase RecQ
MDQSKAILKSIFGYDDFRPLQAEIIENILHRKDTLVIMPTGGGKSLCYQIPGLIYKGLTVVVSPLISLMKDQVEQLAELGVAAGLLNSSLSLPEYRNNVEKVRRGELKLLYMAPETLLKPSILELLSSVTVDCLTIDEAHCISEWGHDFRPEYRQLVQVRKRFPKAGCIALTATATPRVREDIKASLGFDGSSEFIASFDRNNLFLRITPKDNPLDQAIDFIRKFPDQSGIIYCFSRRQVDGLSLTLKNHGFSVRPYHAGLSEQERNRNQDLFIRDDVNIIVATIAFGMGINKPNVRFVVHYDLPQNIESYYQEIGRAGRDGLRSDCLLLFSYGDIPKIKHFINKKEDHEQRVAGIHLNALLQFVETDACRRIPLLNYFGEEFQASGCDMCDNCTTEKAELIDITIPAQKFLSCVKRTGERFGAGHVIDVLRGSQAKKIFNFGHERLSTYGIGEDYSKKQWFHLSRQFIQKGLLNLDMEFGGLRLTAKAWDVLKGDTPVSGVLREETLNDRREKITDREYDRVLFDELRQKRKTLADKANVPPYVIFSDKTLVEMAISFPQTEDALLDIHGVGAVKCEKYSSHFLGIIQEYCQRNAIEERPRKIKREQSPSPPSKAPKRYVVIGEAYNSGQSVEKIMADFNIKPITFINHLLKYLQDGNVVRSDGLLTLSKISPDKMPLVIKAFKRLGTEFLKPVFDAFDGDISYDELHAVRLYCLSEET